MTPYSILRACFAMGFGLAESSVVMSGVAFPINSQIPPVAYVSEPFEFTFSSVTFGSPIQQLSYTLSNSPSWLSLDSSSRRLSGTPTPLDVGAVSFQLIALSLDDRTPSDITLVVLETRTIYAEPDKLLSQLASGGNVSAPSILILRTQQSFMFSLQPNLFDGISIDTAYYCTSSDGSPLPSWIQFDSKTLHISGTTPPLLAPSPSTQTFSFKLVASSVVGFSEATVEFQILVCDHLLSSDKPQLDVVISRGSSLRIPSLIGTFRIDGSDIERSQLVSVDTDYPDWLEFDSHDLSFAGLVPLDARNSTFSLILRGSNTNVLNTTISLQTSNDSKSTQISLGTVTAFRGSYFTHVITPPSDFHVDRNGSVRVSNLPTWLVFTTANLTLQGVVPRLPAEEHIGVSFLFSVSDQLFNASLLILVSTQPSSTDGNFISTTSLSTIPTKSNNTPASDLNRKLSGKRLVALVLAIVLPLVAVAFLICIIIFWMRRRRKELKRKPNEVNDDCVPPPVVQEAESEVCGSSPVTESIGVQGATTMATADVPQIELSWAPDSLKKTRNRLSKRPKLSHESIVGSSWDDLIDFRARSRDVLPPLPFETVSNSAGMPVRYSMKRSDSRNLRRGDVAPTRSTQMLSQSFRVSQIPNTNAKQPVEPFKRMSGVGHGIVTHTHNTFTEPRSSWQTTLSTIPMPGSRPSTIVLNSFPAPPSFGSVSAITNNQENLPEHRSKIRPTLRLVESDGSNSQKKTNSFSPRSAGENRDVSRVSSRQFDSAASSTSQWEDEVLITDESMGTRADLPARESSCLPFEPCSEAESSSPNWPRLADQESHEITMRHGLESPQRSRKDSFRFI